MLRTRSIVAAGAIFLLSLGTFAEDSVARSKMCITSGGVGLTSDFGSRRNQNKGIKILRMNPGVVGVVIKTSAGLVLYSGPVSVGQVIPLSGVRWVLFKAYGPKPYGTCPLLAWIFN